MQTAVDHSDEKYQCEEMSACPYTGTTIINKIPWTGEKDQEDLEDLEDLDLDLEDLDLEDLDLEDLSLDLEDLDLGLEGLVLALDLFLALDLEDL